jgi:hypothetical protein
MNNVCDNKLFTAIHNAHKTHGQGQKLNSILEDISVLFDLFFKKRHSPFDKQTLWSCCFECPSSFETHYTKYQVIYDAFANNIYESFFSIIMIALQDPPKQWWNTQYELLQ